MVRVLLADDDPAVCSALRLLLEQESGLEVVGEVGAADALTAWLRWQEADILIVDWELPGWPCPDMDACSGRPKLIAISGRAEARAQALAAGADGFVSKTDTPEQILATLRGVLT